MFACKRPTKDGRKRRDCVCEPCQARIKVFGANLNVVEQENLRETLGNPSEHDFRGN